MEAEEEAGENNIIQFYSVMTTGSNWQERTAECRFLLPHFLLLATYNKTVLKIETKT